MDIIVCDLDGTLFNIEHRLHHIARTAPDGNKRKRDWNAFENAIPQDTPNRAVVEILRGMQHRVDQIVFVTGRHERTRQASIDMIRQAIGQDCCFGLHMRRDDDNRTDYVVKQEILDSCLPCDDILFCLDDRQQVVDMWRRNGLVCLQVAEGNF
jgi:acid phosphatase class B